MPKFESLRPVGVMASTVGFVQEKNVGYNPEVVSFHSSCAFLEPPPPPPLPTLTYMFTITASNFNREHSKIHLWKQMETLLGHLSFCCNQSH